jgi:protoporphyrin/coproporphyrin ferrochelatase
MKGVLLMAYGSPEKPEDIEPYYTDIRRGNKPSPELLHELTERYKAIGGTSPLLKITQVQATGLQKELGEDYKVFVGMRHWRPWIHEAVAEMQKAGITEAVGIVLAPHFSSMSIAKYIEKVEEAKKELGYDFEMHYVESWHDEPLYIDALAEKVNEALSRFSEEERNTVTAIYTAHSLPEKILSQGDPYREQLIETCFLLTRKVGIDSWQFAFQSAGRTQEKWLGPDLLEVIEALAAEGKKSLLVCSVGFITDHLEVMYDIDVEAKKKAKELGVHLERAGSLNDHPNLAQLFAQVVKKRIG